jgi:nuclear transport factor 2 (NTF2) superfamily protein
MVRLAIDFENPATEWWENGGRELWEAVGEGFETNAALVERAIAESWIVQASQLPGWSSGSEHSPHPVRMVEVDEDEEL